MLRSRHNLLNGVLVLNMKSCKSSEIGIWDAPNSHVGHKVRKQPNGNRKGDDVFFLFRYDIWLTQNHFGKSCGVTSKTPSHYK